MPKNGEEEDSPLQPKPRSSTASPLQTFFATPMRHSPGQRVHSVEGPGRLSRMGSTAGSEKMVNTGDPAAFRRRKPVSSLTGLPDASSNSVLKGAGSEDDEIIPAVEEGDEVPHDASNGGASDGLKTLPQPEATNGELAESSVASHWGVARASLNLNTSAAAPPGGELKRHSSMYDVVSEAIEARQQEWRERQQTSQFFDSSVVSSVMRQRRLHKSRRTRVLLLLDEPSSSRVAAVVFVAMLVLVFVSVGLVVVGTMEPSDEVEEVLWGLELGCSVVFCLELLLRLAAADAVCSVVSDVYLWIDFASIVPFIVDLIYFAVPEGGKSGADSLLDALRLARLLRLLKLARHYEGTRVLIDALRDSVSALMAPLFFLFVSVVLFSGALYHVEKGGPAEEDFDNIPNCAWFMLVTFSTVGYGDRSPGTWAGKLITCVAIVGGVLFMAMPITIVGSSFASVWEQKETKDVVRKMQELLLERGLRATDVLTVFHEFDTTNDGEIDLQEFKGALEVLGLHLRPQQVRKLFDAFDKDHNNTVDFVEFCHVIFPDLDEEKLLEEYAARIKDTPRTKARSAYVMSMLTGNADVVDGGEDRAAAAGAAAGAAAAAAESPLASLAEESSFIGGRAEMSFARRNPWLGTPGQTRGRMMACRMSAMDENVRLGQPPTDGGGGTAAAPAAAAADPTAAPPKSPFVGRLLRGNSSSKLAVPAGAAERKMYQKKKKSKRERSSTQLPSMPPVAAQDEPAELQLTARVYAAALTERRGGGPESNAGGGGSGGGGSGGGGGGGAAPTAANAAWLGDDRGTEALELLRHALKRMDDLEAEMHKQAARGARDRRAVQEALEVQGQAINAVASRLGATTSQAVVRAFKSSENATGALNSHYGGDGGSAGGEQPPPARGPSLAEARRASRGSMGSSVFSSKAPLGSHEA